MNNCSIEKCVKKYYAKGFCKNHYYSELGKNKERWIRIKNRPKYEDKLRKLKRRWEHRNRRNYRKHSDKIYFGGLRELTIQRDKEKCVYCGMTRAEHIRRWSKDLHVNHKDHTKVNSLDNLETVCVRCHASLSHYR